MLPTGPGTMEEPDGTPVRAVFDVPPGRLRLRMRMEDAALQPLDADIRDIPIRDLTKGVTIATPEVMRARNEREFRALDDDPTAVPVSSREFSRTEHLLVRFVAYAPGGQTPVVTAKLLNRGGQVMRTLDIERARRRTPVRSARCRRLRRGISPRTDGNKRRRRHSRGRRLSRHELSSTLKSQGSTFSSQLGLNMRSGWLGFWIVTRMPDPIPTELRERAFRFTCDVCSTTARTWREMPAWRAASRTNSFDAPPVRLVRICRRQKLRTVAGTSQQRMQSR